MDDLELAERVLSHAGEFPGEFDMSDWVRGRRTRTACRTAACLAGRAMLLSGYTITWERRSPRWSTREVATGFLRPDGSRVTNAHKEGACLLGLSDEELYGVNGLVSLFYLPAPAALRRFREIIEAERARRQEEDVSMGDIGRTTRRRDLEPLPETAPLAEPVPQAEPLPEEAPAVPVAVPA